MLKRNNYSFCCLAAKVSSKTTSKPVIGTSLTDNSKIEFESASEAERVGGFTRTNICACCKGKQKYHKGYTWKYKD